MMSSKLEKETAIINDLVQFSFNWFQMLANFMLFLRAFFFIMHTFTAFKFTTKIDKIKQEALKIPLTSKRNNSQPKLHSTKVLYYHYLAR
jgi:uncharacterized membrane-anchored protein YitT (DUF2179 family)